MTAVQWFGEQALNYLNNQQKNNLIEAFKQALEMEKQQIENAFNAGVNSEDFFYPPFEISESEKYYNETYKKDKS
jgi:hypothetical protein